MYTFYFLLTFEQVEVFIDDEEEEKSQDSIYKEEVEVEESVYHKEEDEDDLDPLKVPLLPFFPLTFTPADSSQSLTPKAQAILPWVSIYTGNMEVTLVCSPDVNTYISDRIKVSEYHVTFINFWKLVKAK